MAFPEGLEPPSISVRSRVPIQFDYGKVDPQVGFEPTNSGLEDRRPFLWDLWGRRTDK